jgi:hypothetical protein
VLAFDGRGWGIGERMSLVGRLAWEEGGVFDA